MFYQKEIINGKMTFIFIDCVVHSEFYKNKSFGGSA